MDVEKLEQNIVEAKAVLNSVPSSGLHNDFESGWHAGYKEALELILNGIENTND